MTQRMLALVRYFMRSLLYSLAGVLYILLALASWWIFFPPNQTTPHVDYYILIIAILGAVFSFLVTFTMAARANQAIHYPIMVRLPNRIEYLVTVLLSALGFAMLLQLLVAALATFHGPAFTLTRIVQIPIVWLPVNVVLALLALQASDLVANSWSRVFVYGGLTLCVSGQQVGKQMDNPLLSQICGAVFWPFQSVVEAVRAGFFSPLQMLAWIVIVLYAVILWQLAVEWFVDKDLHLTAQ